MTNRIISEALYQQVVEAVAEAIYNQWEGVEGFVPWFVGGNSDRQNFARSFARESLAALSTAPQAQQPKESA